CKRSLAALDGKSWIPVAACAAGKWTAISAKMNRLAQASSKVDRERLLLNTLTLMHESSIDVRPFSVRLSLHGDLDFFLPSRTRRKDITRSLSEKTSVKDVIESCGVPHPDVAYDPQAHDRQLLDAIDRENRAHLTRDRRLLMHAVVRTGYCPRSQDPDEQTVEVIRRFTLLGLIAPFTRCLRCNAQLQETTKADIIEELEPLTKIYYEQFRRCTGCGKIY